MSADDSAQGLIAVDIGNSWIKLGRFAGKAGEIGANEGLLPKPAATLELPLTDRAGQFDGKRATAWCAENDAAGATWWVGSVHRGATEQLATVVNDVGSSLSIEQRLHLLTYRDVRLTVEVDFPERVGIDRLLGALAANRLRERGRPAIVVDLGTAIKVDLVTAAGTFAGGAILPGLSMSARALEEHTDALPHVAVESWQAPPRALGKSTIPAIESGLFWGAVGAVRELIGHISQGLESPPQVFATGGNSRLIVEPLKSGGTLQVLHVPHLVLSGVALAYLAHAAKL